MLAYDSQRLDRKTKNPNREHFDKCTALLKELGPSVEIQLLGGTNKKGIFKFTPDFSPKINVSRAARYINGDLDFQVTVFDNQRTLPNGMVSFHPTHIPIRGNRIFSTSDGKDLELLYFLVFISPGCELVDYPSEDLAMRIKALQNTNRHVVRPRFRVRVSLFEARKTMRRAENVSKLMTMLSSGQVSDRRITDKLYSLKLMVDPNKEINRARLLSHFMSSKDGQPDHEGIEQFVNGNNSESDKLVALAYRAIDTQALTLTPPSPGMDGAYYYKDQDGNNTIPFLTIKYAMGDPVMQLVGAMTHDSELSDLLAKLVK